MKLIAANWKSNPDTAKTAERLALAEDYEGVIIIPPFQYLERVRSVLKHASLGAQNVFWENGGPFTGEVSPSQLKNLSVSFVIAGHSERRAYLGLCVGEPIQIRKDGIRSAKDFITNQIRYDLRGVKRSDAKKVIITYEPIWAISTSQNAEPDIPEEAAEICAYIKNLVNVRGVIYGGSVNAKNAKEFLGRDDIDGALVGGESLKPKEFQKIVSAATPLV
uniref:Triosephosphate isomerase n=1 Tax=uncultured Parcubacteria bacterium Rifle_16ft_4_minimus_23790 TaxID=1665136 RepID=A0A0H4TF14_9BACT|nr:triosephosphate isomerase, triosephosphate isomerase (TIM) [uncultured Parcubacteria bacterium Rifle_16ft_4_minimus_23790]